MAFLRDDAMCILVSKPGKKSQENGFTLIEVLVAITLLALGASGVAAMQLRSLRMTQQSGFQTTATQLAVTLADLMRTDPELARLPGSPYLFSYQAGAMTNNTPSSLVCMQHICDGATMATAEVQRWQQQLQQTLPRARAVVCRDSNPATANRLQWSCDHAANAAIVIKIGWSAREPVSTSAASVATEPSPHIAIAVAI